MEVLTSSPRLSARLGVVFLWLLAGASALSAEMLQLLDGGRLQNFELPGDEVYVAKWGAAPGELAREVPAKIAGATVVREYGRRVWVKLPAAVDRAKASRSADPALAALPQADLQPVIYLNGVKHGEGTARTITREAFVDLAPGEPADALRTHAGAQAVRSTKVPGRVILTFANSFAALDAVTRLQGEGRKATLLLGRILERMAVPNDPYFPQQWHLQNTGQGGGAPGIDANVVNAWDISKGTNVHIVINDDSMQTQQTAATPGTGHPDLVANTRPVDSGLHYDFRDGDNDPNPDPATYDAHGTAVSGVAAARGNNGIGVSGAAPEANLVGVRTIGSFVTDADIASSVEWAPAGYDPAISNNSWGYTGAPGLRDIDISIKTALQDATLNNRGGLGQITVFANGNSQQQDDNGNFTTLANSRFVVAVGAINNFGTQSYYSNPGANLLISAPSNGGSLDIFTTDGSGNLGYNPVYGIPGEPADTNYTASFGGTSSATPLTTGCIALMLQANPNLGWRDVHEVLAQAARQVDSTDSDWVTNGAGFHFNHKYGAGMVDATAGVVLARDWVNLPAETAVSKSLTPPQIPAVVPDNNATGISRTFDLTASPNLRIERVELRAKITTQNRSDLEVALISPDGTTSILAPKHARPAPSTGDDDIDFNTSDNVGWTFTSTHHWGENTQGIWRLRIRDLTATTTATLQSATLTLHGIPSSTQRVRFAAQRTSVLENAGTALVHVERLGPSTGTVTVDYLASSAVTANSAIAGTDFDLTPGTLTFADGETSKDITVNIHDNAVQNANRFVYLILKNPGGATLGGPALCRLDIVDDESNIVSVAPGDFDIAESANLPNPGTFVISRSKPSPQPLTVNFSLTGTATEGLDYTTIAHTATIPANSASVSVTITPINDGLREGTETIILTLDPSIDYGIGVPDTAQLNLIDDDVPLVNITSSSPDNIAQEQGLVPGKIRITRYDPASHSELAPPEALLVNVNIGGSATPGVNYVAIPTPVVIPSGQSHVDLIVTPIDDTEYHNPGATVVVNLDKSTDYGFDFSTAASVVILDNEQTPDATVAIVDPALKAQLTAPATLVASGTAHASPSVSRVMVSVNGGAFQMADGVTATVDTPWSLDVTAQLIGGVNNIRVRSFDKFDNASAVVSRDFVFVQPRTLSVSIDGAGSVSNGFAPSSVRNAGFSYVVTAVPAAGSIFAGWTGAAASNDPALIFQMPNADSALTAHFIVNPFDDATAGNYQGLLRGQTGFAFETSGFFQAKLAATGMFTGSVTLAGVKYPVKGRFTGNQPVAGSGRFLGSVKRKKPLSPLLLDLRVDITGPTRSITGTVADLNGLTSDVTATRLAFDKKKHPYLPAAQGPQLFTFQLPPPPGATTLEPRGNGFGTVSIDASGMVTLDGQFPDGSKISQKTGLNKDAGFPFYVSLLNKAGVALGDFTVATGGMTDLSGKYDWFKPSLAKEKFFPFGFTFTQLAASGDIYSPPAAGRVLSGFDTATNNAGSVQFRDGNLKVGGNDKQFDTAIQVSADNKVTVTSANLEKAGLKIDPKKGTFSGGFVHPISGVKTPFSGVFLQKSQQGIGGFNGSSIFGTPLQTGRVTIVPIP